MNLRSTPLKTLFLLFSLVLKLVAAPANDHFSSPTVLTGLPVTMAGTNAGASIEPSEPMPGGGTHSRSIWYQWTSTTTGPVEIHTGGGGDNVDTVLAAWSGNTLATLTQLAMNDDADFDGADDGESRIFLNATAGTTYRIAIYEYGDEEEGGNVRLTIRSDTSSRIEGTLTGEDGVTPLEQIQVRAYYWDDYYEEWDSEATSYTDTEGKYIIRVPDAGDYRLRFYDPQGYYIQEYYENASNIDEASDISVGDLQVVGGIDASLVESSEITGTVTAPDGITPAPGIEVTAYDEYWEYASTAVTDASGYYRLRGLSDQSYRIRFRDNTGKYLTEYHLNASNLDSATSVVVPETSVIVGGIDASLGLASHITGRVTAADGTTPLPQIRVRAYLHDEFSDEFDGDYATETEADGTYDIGGLPAGSYAVYAYDDDDYFEPAYYHVSGGEGFTQVVVGNLDTVTGIDISLRELSKITGRVTAADGVTPLEGIEVRLYYEDDDYWETDNETTTDSAGNYVLRGIYPDTYRIRFYDPKGNYLNEYYQNAITVWTATDIAVGSSVIVGGINASLATASHIKGKVTAADGISPVRYVNVQAYQWDDTEEDWNQVGWASTNADGTYDMGGLTAGTYRVHFMPEDGGYQSEYYNNATSLASATDIVVGDSATVANISAELAENSKITGKVTASDGVTPLQDIRIRAYYWDEYDDYWYYDDEFQTNVDGTYTLAGLDPGSYRIRFHSRDGAYLSEFYDNAATLETATDVTVGTSVTIAGIDASLDPASSITGKVTSANGNVPLRYVEVEANLWNEVTGEWDTVSYAETRTDGTYNLGNLRAGTYRVGFFDYEEGHASQYYLNASNVSTATDIVVGTAATVPNINATLMERSKIMGTVTGPDGVTPLDDIQVRAYYWDEYDEFWTYDSSTYTDSQGHYTITGVNPGNYRLRFNDTEGNHLMEFYDDASHVGAATDVVVTNGSDVNGIDASLDSYAAITGTVTAAQDSSPLTDIEVVLYEQDPISKDWYPAETTATNWNGTYSFEYLRPGTYRVGFFDYAANYQYEYHGDALDVESSADIRISSIVPGMVDAALIRAELVKPQVVRMTMPDPAAQPGSYSLQLYGGVGQRYQLQGSTNLSDWVNIGSPVNCGFESLSIPVSSTETKQFWRFKSVP